MGELEIWNRERIGAVQIERLVVLIGEVRTVESAGGLQRRGIAGQRAVEGGGSADRLICQFAEALEVRRRDMVFHVRLARVVERDRSGCLNVQVRTLHGRLSERTATILIL